MKNKKYKFIDLFCGIGGFRIALQRNNAECVFSSDNNANCQKVYNLNFNETPHGDITQIEYKDIPDFDILTAGFPCQPFSFAGKKLGFEDKTRGTLFFNIIMILETKKPKMFLLENVKGLRTHNGGKTLQIIRESLDALGYTFYTTVLNSYDFGVPQYRERWYCVGFDKDISFQFPTGGKRGSKIKDIAELDNSDESLILPNNELDMIDFHFSKMKNRTDRIEHDKSKFNHFAYSKKGKWGIYSYLKPDNALRFHVGDTAKSQIQDYYYVSLESVAPTIIATRAPKYWDLRRRFSIKENLRIQGFPDNFKFNVSENTARRLLGNSVTVPVIESIFKEMIFFYELNQKSNFTSDNYLIRNINTD